eukprot:3635842-Rhodomonas_salina.4
MSQSNTQYLTPKGSVSPSSAPRFDGKTVGRRVTTSRVEGRLIPPGGRSWIMVLRGSSIVV